MNFWTMKSTRNSFTFRNYYSKIKYSKILQNRDNRDIRVVHFCQHAIQFKVVLVFFFKFLKYFKPISKIPYKAFSNFRKRIVFVYVKKHPMLSINANQGIFWRQIWYFEGFFVKWNAVKFHLGWPFLHGLYYKNFS